MHEVCYPLRVQGFGTEGVVDISKNLDTGDEVVSVSATTPGVVFEDYYILGMRCNESFGASPGHIRAWDARTGEFCDLVERGIVDPTKVARSAIQNAASAAGMFLTTEVAITDLPDDKPEAGMPPGGGMPGMGGMGGMM